MITLDLIQTRLRESIRNSPLSQKEIAKAIGVSPQTVSKYMKNEVFPALDTFANLCQLLDVKTDYVLGLSDY
ncbi:MAG: helix-turn-helix domain-containing protein [Clostridiales bacterium]|nr:helix-turn-helix domain-containing protein [Clostridiales bacterium]